MKPEELPRSTQKTYNDDYRQTLLLSLRRPYNWGGLAKGILPYVNFFAINQETLHRYNVIIARGCKANDVLKIVSLLEHIPSMSIDGKFNASTEFYGISKYYTMMK